MWVIKCLHVEDGENEHFVKKKKFYELKNMVNIGECYHSIDHLSVLVIKIEDSFLSQ